MTDIIYLCYCYYRSNKLVLYDIIMRSVKMKKRDSWNAFSFFLPIPHYLTPALSKGARAKWHITLSQYFFQYTL